MLVLDGGEQLSHTSLSDTLLTVVTLALSTVLEVIISIGRANNLFDILGVSNIYLRFEMSTTNLIIILSTSNCLIIMHL